MATSERYSFANLLRRQEIPYESSHKSRHHLPLARAMRSPLAIVNDALGIDSEQVQHGGLQIGRGDGAVFDEGSLVVGGAEDGAAGDAAAGRQHAVGVGPVVAAAAIRGRV